MNASAPDTYVDPSAAPTQRDLDYHSRAHQTGSRDQIPELVSATKNIAAETAARIAADATETAARIAADVAEATARANADTAEAATRLAADNTLQTNITSEATTRAAADTALSGRVTVLEGLEEAKLLLTPSFQLPSNSTVLTNVTGFGLTLLANAVWHFRMTLLYNSSAAANCKFAFTGPAGCALFATVGAFTDATAVFHGGVGLGLGGSVNLLGTATTVGVEISGTIVNGGTAGTFQLQAAQNSAVVETTDFIVVDTNMQATRVV